MSQDSAGQMKFVLNLFIILHGHDLDQVVQYYFIEEEKVFYYLLLDREIHFQAANYFHLLVKI